MSHFPYQTTEGLEYDQRYQEMRPKDEGMVILHGHLHGRYQKYGRMIDLGFDAHGKILTEEDVISLIDDPRDFIESPLTEYYRSRKADPEANRDL